jgi:hypothetical protein
LQSIIPARSRISRVKKKTRLARLNSDTQEVVKLTEILHSKLLLQRGDNSLKQLWTEGCQDNVINIEQEAGRPSRMVIDENRSVRLGLNEPQGEQERGKPKVPSSGSLLQTIERLVEPAD